MSSRHWTPYQIEILLHHYCGPAEFPRADAIYPETATDLMLRGMLRPNTADQTAQAAPSYIPSKYEITDAGRVFIEMLLQTPAPRQIWQDPRTGKEVTPETHYTAAGRPDSSMGLDLDRWVP